jgi:hypothetical protein
MKYVKKDPQGFGVCLSVYPPTQYITLESGNFLGLCHYALLQLNHVLGSGSSNSCGGIIQKDQKPSEKSWGRSSSTSQLTTAGEFVYSLFADVILETSPPNPRCRPDCDVVL